MRILIVTNHFWPEEFRVNDLALELKQRGHDITVITGIPNYPAGSFFEGYGIFRKRVEDFNGITIKRFPIIPRGKGTGLNLLINYLSLALSACCCAPFYASGTYDLIFVFETSPVTVGLPAIVLKKLKSIPILFWVLDLWPESLSATKSVSSPFILQQVERLVRFIYKRCDRILVSSPGFVSSVMSRGGRKDQIDYFPNWVEPSYVSGSRSADENNMPVLPEGFRVMFAGNIGAAQDFGTILSAAEHLQGNSDIHWIIVGDGRMSGWVKEQVKQRGLQSSVHLLGRYPAEMMTGFFTQADVMLVTLKRDKIFELTVPGKIQSFMASGKPIVAALDGEGGGLVERSGAGLACPAENPELLAETVLSMYRMSPEERKAMGEKGEDYCRKHFDRSMLMDRLEGWMKETVFDN